LASLNSVELKIFRAALHLKGLEPELERYFQGNPGKLVREPNSPADNPTFTFVAREEIPARFGLIVGDCLQNLRSSLDYLVWELVLAAKNTPGRHNMFPICSDPKTFKQALGKRNRLLGVHPDAAAEIEALQPYHLGKDFEKAVLWVLEDLTNVNKHRRILLTNLVAGEKHHAHTIIEKDGELWMSTGPGAPPVFDCETKFGPYPVIDGKVHMDTELVAFVAFNEGPAKGMEITLCLNEWAVYIKDTILPRFKKFF